MLLTAASETLRRMRVHLLGHACLLVEGGDGDAVRVLVDPLFFGPGERTLDPCPKRLVHRERLGPLTALAISHAHIDHFDREALRTLPKNLPVFLPSDPALATAVAELGFTDRRALAPFDETALNGLRVFATPSRDDLPEVGFVFADAQGSVWDQVDTVVRQNTVIEVATRLPRLDLNLAAFNPLLEHATMWTEEVDFPQARYERLLEVAIGSRARLTVPGSFGLRITGRFAEYNQRCYPVSRERFVADLAAVAPELPTRIVQPGECVVLESGAVPRIEPSPYATLLVDDTHLTRFAPSQAAAPALVDANPTRLNERELGRTVAHLLEVLLARRLSHLLDGRTTLPPPLVHLRDRRAVVDLEVIFPAGARRWRIRGWRSPIHVVSVGAADPEPDYIFTYVASQLVTQAEGRPYQEPEVRAWRRRLALPGRLSALQPARLKDVDPYETVDETYSWNPLGLLVD